MTIPGSQDRPQSNALAPTDAGSNPVRAAAPAPPGPAAERPLEYRIDRAHGDSTAGKTVDSRLATDAAGQAPADQEPAVWRPPPLRPGTDQQTASKCLVTLRIGKLSVPTAALAQWQAGATIDCPSQQDGFVEVVVDGQVIARGVPMVWKDRLCIRVTELVGAAPRSAPATDGMT